MPGFSLFTLPSKWPKRIIYRSGLSHDCHEIVLKPKLNTEIKQEMINLFDFDHG